VPAGTDPQIKAILEKFLADVTSDPEFVKMYTDMNMSVDYLNAKDSWIWLQTTTITLKPYLTPAHN